MEGESSHNWGLYKALVTVLIVVGMFLSGFGYFLWLGTVEDKWAVFHNWHLGVLFGVPVILLVVCWMALNRSEKRARQRELDLI